MSYRKYASRAGCGSIVPNPERHCSKSPNRSPLPTLSARRSLLRLNPQRTEQTNRGKTCVYLCSFAFTSADRAGGSSAPFAQSVFRLLFGEPATQLRIARNAVCPSIALGKDAVNLGAVAYDVVELRRFDCSCESHNSQVTSVRFVMHDSYASISRGIYKCL